MEKTLSELPMPNAQCPMPNAQCPIPLYIIQQQLLQPVLLLLLEFQRLQQLEQ
jgi:hypothetical protein